MFVFGETPAQAARMGYDIAQQNRQAFTRANELEADYAFRTNQMENAAAQNMAALARAQQQEQNQLAREAFMFGEQAKRQSRADAMARLEFDTQRKDVEREFAFAEKEDVKEKNRLEDDLDNSGRSLSFALSQLIPAQQAVRKQVDDASAQIGKIIKKASLLGFAYDEGKKRVVGAGNGTASADDLNRDLTMARLALNDAKARLPEVERNVNAAKSQALNLGFSFTPNAIQHVRRGKVFPLVFETGTPSIPTAAPAPSTPAPTSPRAGFIPLSPSQASRLRGERERDSWEAVATEAQALGQDFPSGF